VASPHHNFASIKGYSISRKKYFEMKLRNHRSYHHPDEVSTFHELENKIAHALFLKNKILYSPGKDRGKKDRKSHT
jgi:hypothetical protein